MPCPRKILEADAHRTVYTSVHGLLVSAAETSEVVIDTLLVELIKLASLVLARDRHDLFCDLSREDV